MKEVIRSEISSDLEENYTYIQELLADNTDAIFRQFKVGQWQAAVIYIEGLADKALLNDYVMESLMIFGDRIKNVKEIKDRLVTVTDIKPQKRLDKAINALLTGETILMIDGLEEVYIIATRLWPARGVSDPSGETVIRGSREGLVETMRFNTALIRRRIRDTRLKVESVSVGTRSKTDVVIMYIDDIVNRDVLTKVKDRLEKIKIDAILDSGYIEQLVEDNKWSIFPQIQSTERPDVVAAALYEGRVAIIVDNSPFTLLAPTTLVNLFQSPDDYYQRWIYSSIIRLIRLIAIFLSLVLPALYVAVTSFHTIIIPRRLAYSMASTREGIPFPAYVEAIIMEVSMALLIEAVIRLPKGIGTTIGIVGGLIIGQAAVTAGIVSPFMIIIVSVTTITTFMTPNYEAVASLRIIRFTLIIAASVIGLYGITIMLIVYLIHIIRLESFGIPYMSPIVNTRSGDLKDTFIRSPLQYFKKRPEYMNPQDRVRQK
ncbi:spore germination protein [Clostridium thermarum]|uniref:spore germination protein n=1 Tax=Clostridium thermarum TaxID=1716543 RepID=UPI00112247AE|nr:spore germination protein [Clostridium thermarum]